MKNYFIILTLLCYYSAHSQLKGYYESGSTSLSIDTVRGMYNGKCILWDKNGRKRIEGHYTNNQKSGNWTAWDTLGNVLMRAKFQNSYQFTNLELYNLDGLKMKRLSDTDFLQKIYNDSIAKERRRREWSTVTMEQIMAEKREREARRPNDSFGYIEYLLERDSSGVKPIHMLMMMMLPSERLFSDLLSLQKPMHIYSIKIIFLKALRGTSSQNPRPKFILRSNL